VCECVSVCGGGCVISLSYLTSSVTAVTFSVADPVVADFLLYTRDREDLP